MPRRTIPSLTHAEQPIMNVLWDKGEANVREVTAALQAEHGLPYNSVLRTTRILSDKGFVGFREKGSAYIYRNMVTRLGAQRTALGSLVTSLLQGSPKKLAMHLVEDEQLSLDDVEALREALLRQKSSASGPTM